MSMNAALVGGPRLFVPLRGVVSNSQQSTILSIKVLSLFAMEAS